MITTTVHLTAEHVVHVKHIWVQADGLGVGNHGKYIAVLTIAGQGHELVVHFDSPPVMANVGEAVSAGAYVLQGRIIAGV